MNANKSPSNETLASDLGRLLFELSHGWRLEILFKIRGQAKRHSELSKDLKMSPQETTRHLVRLTEMRLIQKDTEGKYHLTNIGKLVLAFIPALNVISKHSEFFLTHDISGIPNEYILRLGELNNSTMRKTETLSTLNRAIQTIKGTKGKVRLMNVGRLESLFPPTLEKRQDIEFECILPAADEETDQPKKIRLEHCRYLNEIKLTMILTDEIAAICLPLPEGKMDYATFLASADSSFKKWCKDLFEHYWAKARPKKP